MMYLFDATGHQEAFYSAEGSTYGGHSIDLSDATTVSSSAFQSPVLDSDELLATYVARESYVPSMLRLMLDMSEEQRRLSLAMLQSVSAGNFLASHEGG